MTTDGNEFFKRLIINLMKKVLMFATAASAAFMLGSCSKDLTSDVAPSLAGNSKVIAEFTFDNDAETRTFLGNDQKFYWEAGDAIGVFEATDITNTQSYFGYISNGEFAGNLGFFEAEAYYGYYPYAKGTKIEGGSIALPIDANQQYNFAKEELTYGSFYSMTAPAVAYGTAMDSSKLPLTFRGVASYVRIPIKGYGTVKSLELTIGDLKLNGTVTVKKLSELAKLKATDQVPAGSLEWEGVGESITLDCGKGVVLDAAKPTYFWFVIPAGQTVVENKEGAEATLTVKATMSAGTEIELTRKYTTRGLATPVNGIMPITPEDKTQNAFVITEDNGYLISTPEQFLKYAYAATNELTDEDVADGAGLKPAILLNDLDFSTINEGIAVTTDMTTLEFTAYKAWNENETKSIPAIGGSKVYSIDGKNFAIKNLTVTSEDGKGMFGGTKTVKNLKLENVVVEATANEAAEYVYLVDNYEDVENIVFGDGNKLTVGGKTTGGKRALVYETTSDKFVAKPAKAVSGASYYAINFTAKAGKVLPLNGAAVTGETALLLTNTYHNIILENNGVVFALASSYAENETSNYGFEKLKSTIAAYKENSRYSFSAVVRKSKSLEIEKSLWTGGRYAKNSDGIYTAEEMAYELANFSTKSIIMDLTCDIDLQNQPWALAGNQNETAVMTIKGNNKTIANVNLDYSAYLVNGQTADETKGLEEVKPLGSDKVYFTLFGGKATVNNLTVDGITIKIPNKTTANAFTPVVAAFAGTGTASNSTVKGLTIDTSKYAFAIEKGIGGMFQTLTHSQFGKNNTVELSKIASYTSKTVKEPIYGHLAATADVTLANLDVTTYDLGTTTVSANAKVFGQISFATPNPFNSSKHVVKNDIVEITINFNGIDAAAMTPKTAWNWEKCNASSRGGDLTQFNVMVSGAMFGAFSVKANN